MNILGMGPMEIVLIVVLALIVFGPAKLPEIMGQVGRAIADFRRATSSLSDEFNRTIQAELAETRGVFDETKSAVTGVHTSINAALSGTTATAPTVTATATAPVASESNGTNGVHTAPETPPLADNTQWSWETAAPGQTEPGVAVASPPAPAPAVVTEAAGSAAEKAAQRPTPPRRPTRSDDLLPPY